MEDLAKAFSQIDIEADEDFVLALEKDILEITLGDNLAHTWPTSTIWGRVESPVSGEGAGNFLVDPKPLHLIQQANPRREPFDELSHIDYKLQGVVADVAKALDALCSTAGDRKSVV